MRPARPQPLAVAVVAALLCAPAVGRAALNERTWRETKCDRYKVAWTALLARRKPGEIGADFVRAHEAFLAGGCTARADVCPRSQAEFALANALTIAAMNSGTASTFLPFACRG